MIILLMRVLTAGCRRTSRDLPLDQTRAREACSAFLKAWQEGRSVDDLKPDLIGRDADWDAGEKLLSFDILPEEVNDGTNLHISVRLNLENAKGVKSSPEVVYTVGTSPVTTVFRE